MELQQETQQTIQQQTIQQQPIQQQTIQQQTKYDFMKDFISRNVNEASEITINHGKKQTDFIFDIKMEKINNDIIPVDRE